MKKELYSIFALFFLALAAVSCYPEAEPYSPAEVPDGDQLYFPNSFNPDVDIYGLDSDKVGVPVCRVVSSAAKTYPLAVSSSSDKATVPAEIAFPEGSLCDTLWVALDTANIAFGETIDVEIALKDNTSPYGKDAVSVHICKKEPELWVKWDTGTLTEAAWGEVEKNKVMYYKQLNDTLRLCKIDDCWGYETILGGEEYDVQPYTWLWDTKSNKCVVRAQYIGYSDSGNQMFASDAPGFYSLYQGWGQETLGDAEYFAWAVRNASKYGFTLGYYDGNGGFYLADSYFWVAGGAATGSGIQVGGEQDTFIGGSYERSTDYEKLPFGPVSTGVDSSSFWKDPLDITVATAADPANDSITAVKILNYAGEAGLIFLAEETEDGFVVKDQGKVQHTGYEVFGKELGLSIVEKGSTISGPATAVPCEITLFVEAGLYNVSKDTLGNDVYTLDLSLGQFKEKILLDSLIWFNDTQLRGAEMADFQGTGKISADCLKLGGRYEWPASIEYAGMDGARSFFYINQLVEPDNGIMTFPADSNYYIAEYHEGFLFLDAGATEGLLPVTPDTDADLYVGPINSQTRKMDDNASLVGGFVNDSTVAFVNYSGNKTYNDGLYFIGLTDEGDQVLYDILANILFTFDTPAPAPASKTFSVPSNYQVRPLSQTRRLEKAIAGFDRMHHSYVSCPPARIHGGSIDTSKAVKVEKKTTVRFDGVKHNIAY